MRTREPLENAQLHLMIRNPPNNKGGIWGQTWYSVISQSDGSFTFEGVQPGEYTLRGEKAGYLLTSYGSRTGMTEGITLALQPGQQLAGIQMHLIQQATITGRVLHEGGDPVPNALVQAITFVHMSGLSRYLPRGQAMTDEAGTYRIDGLPPGAYYIVTQLQRPTMGIQERPTIPGKPNLQPMPTYYPSSLDRAGAIAIQVKTGQEIPGVDIRQRTLPAFHVRGKLTGQSNNEDKTQTIVTLQPADGSVLFLGPGMTVVRSDHTFDIANVAPGSYTLSVPGFTGKKETASQPVEVGSADVNDVIVTVHPAFAIHGLVELQGSLPGIAKEKALENVRVIMIPDDLSLYLPDGGSTSKADGTFMLENVPPLKMKVHVDSEPEGAYVKSIRFGKQDAMGKTLDLTEASGGDLRIVLRAGEAQVSGTVVKKRERNAVDDSAAMILLIPEDLTRNGGSVHSTNTNQNGAFTEKGMAPGVYYAVAFESEDFRGWDDPTVLKQLVDRGTKVEVQENDKKQVQVTMLSAEDLQAALTAAGIAN